MKVPLSWLSEFVDLKKTPEEIADTLSSLGIEVEKIINPIPSFTGVVVGKVTKIEPHPNADLLKIATVSDGTTAYQVVCGAPNCRNGILVAFAQLEAELSSGKIKKKKIRGVDSEGMLCAADELGVLGTLDEIIEFPIDTPIGANVAPFLLDPIFDISLTPNLGHCLSVLGIARELAAAYSMAVKIPITDLKESHHEKIDVTINEKKLVPRYACRMMTGVTVAPSPSWLQKKIISAGFQPVNNLVDIGNYVMLERGQPLHIFDANTIEEKKIIISCCTDPFFIETIDKKNREIPPNTLLISDSKKPLAIAGIIGAASSAVTEETRKILIEAAFFDPVSIRKTSRFLDLRTEAAHRFDRGVDGGAGLLEALNQAALLIQKIAGGEIHCLVDLLDKDEMKENPSISKKVSFRLSRLYQVAGLHLSTSEVVSLLERLDLRVNIVDEKTIEVLVPTYRHDLHTEIDLIEEVVRLYGYSNLLSSDFSPLYRGSTFSHDPTYKIEKESRNILLQQGFQECLTCDLISPTFLTLGKLEKNGIHVLHPRSIDQSVMRTSLLPGLLQVVRHNTNHQMPLIRVFEIGRVHFKDSSSQIIQEPSCLGIVLMGKRDPYHFASSSRDVDFFDIKGVIENFLDRINITPYSFHPSHLHLLHPWRQAQIKSGEITLGVVGELHPNFLHEWGFSQRLFFAELNLSDLIDPESAPPLYSPFSNFPSSERDWTITVKASIPIASITQIIKEVSPALLEKFYLLTLYTNDQLGKDQKNVTFRFIYRDRLKTISYDKVEEEHQKIIHSVAKKLADSLS